MSEFSNTLNKYEQRRLYNEALRLGDDVNMIKNQIYKSASNIVSVYESCNNSLLVSQERISGGVENLGVKFGEGINVINDKLDKIDVLGDKIVESNSILNLSLDRIEKGIDGLRAEFEWGISELVWQLEQNRSVMRDILDVLSAPLDTQSKELRKRASEAYLNGWIEEALSDYLESEMKNKYDFSVHISVGMIYLFHKIDRVKALEYFDKAAKYSRPKSKYYTSYALLYKALIKRDAGDINEAESLTDEAVNLSPEFTEAIYQNAHYNAMLRNKGKALSRLDTAISIDINYCFKAGVENDFNFIGDEINKLFEKYKNIKAIEFNDVFEKVNNIFDRIKYNSAKYDMFGHIDVVRKIEDAIERIKNIRNRDSLLDYMEAIQHTLKAIDSIKRLMEIIISDCTALSNSKNNICNNINSEINNLKNRIDLNNAVLEKNICAMNKNKEDITGWADFDIKMRRKKIAENKWNGYISKGLKIFVGLVIFAILINTAIFGLNSEILLNGLWLIPPIIYMVVKHYRNTEFERNRLHKRDCAIKEVENNMQKLLLDREAEKIKENEDMNVYKKEELVYLDDHKNVYNSYTELKGLRDEIMALSKTIKKIVN